MTARTLKAKRGGRSLRKWRLTVAALRLAARSPGYVSDPLYVWDLNATEWTCGPQDPRVGRTFRGWRHPQAVGR